MASGNRTDISLDDPNFWDKWAKKADIDMEMVNGRVCTSPQIIQYAEQSIITTYSSQISVASHKDIMPRHTAGLQPSISVLETWKAL